MKTKVMVLCVLISFSSCYSYKNLDRDLESYEQEERVKLVLNDKKRKGKFVAIYGDTLMIKTTGGAIEQVKVSEILEIKTGKFSWMKTILIPPVVVFGVAYAAVVFFGEPSYDIDLGFND